MTVPSESIGSVPSADLRSRTLRGGAITLGTQGIRILARFGTMAVMARFVSPADFGLVAMVTAITGFVSLFKDGGLSTATIQRNDVSHAQLSTLFWINLAVGAALAVLLAISAPLVSLFYGDPRLVLITVALSGALLLDGGAVQHDALLRRQLRFGALATIDITSLLVSAAVGISLAFAGFDYWALVGMALASPLVALIGAWIATGWCPGLPRKGTGVRGMLAFGGQVTARSVLIYLARNADNVLIGWAWGPTALGFYSRAYQLLMLPIQQFNSPVSAVAIPALSRLQEDPVRFRRYFLQGYSAVVAFGAPVVGAAALFSDELIHLAFGPGWEESARLFRFLAPAALAGALMNPMGWLLVPLGLVGRNLRIALIINPLIILAFFVGLPFGSEGVALAYSVAMVVLTIPCFHLFTRDTCVGLPDVLRAIAPPLASLALAAAITAGINALLLQAAPTAVRAVAGPLVLLLTYLLILLFVFRQRTFLAEFLRSFRRTPAPLSASGSAP